MYNDSPRSSFRFSSDYRSLLILFVSVDLALIGLDAYWGFGAMMDWAPPRPYYFRINSDFGIAECFNFLKWGIGAAFLFLAGRNWWPAALALFLMLLDDMLMLHELAGAFGSEYLGSSFGSMSKAAGELSFIVLLAMIVFGLILLTAKRLPRASRHLAIRIITLFILLGFFGVGVDQIHSAAKSTFESHALNSILAILENGGEMIAISLIAAHSRFILQAY